MWTQIPQPAVRVPMAFPGAINVFNHNYVGEAPTQMGQNKMVRGLPILDLLLLAQAIGQLPSSMQVYDRIQWKEDVELAMCTWVSDT